MNPFEDTEKLSTNWPKRWWGEAIMTGSTDRYEQIQAMARNCQMYETKNQAIDAMIESLTKMKD